MIQKGDVYWVPVFDSQGNKREILHPQVVIQETVINSSRIDTIVVCGISTNMKRISEPGNVLLDSGEANLAKQSIVVVSQVSTAKKEYFDKYIGSLSNRRMDQIFAGMKLIQSLGRH